jgi:hypothetical protein
MTSFVVFDALNTTDYGYMTANELRGCYQASCDETRAEILEVLTDRFDYDRDYYMIVGDAKEYALWYVAQPA